VDPEPKNIPKTKYAKMYITRNHTSKIRLDLVSITSRIGFVDTSAAGSSLAGLLAGLLAGGFVAGGFVAGGFVAGGFVVGGFVAGGSIEVGLAGGFVLPDADISFYIILRYFFR
jgi:hypothetical protein